jgi:enterobactin synthetase component D
MAVDVAFRIDLPHGRCVGVRIPAHAEPGSILCPGADELAEEERAYLQTLSPVRRPSWLAGRLALHGALADLGLDCGPILSNTRGAPDLPDGVTGSISHKQTLAVALATHGRDGLSIGVDIEPAPSTPPSTADRGWNSRPDISSRVMTPDELTALASVPESLHRRTVVLHFSVKEAIYKAINPLVGRYVSFQEASIVLSPNGEVHVRLALKHKEGPFMAEARWMEIAGHLLTTATVRPA